MTPFPLIGFTGPIPNSWTLSDQSAMSVHIEAPGRSYVRNASSRPAYIVLGGETGDFTVLAEGHGVALPPESAVLLDVALTASGNAKTETVIIEYDDRGERLGDRRIPEGRHLYSPSPRVRRVLVALRMGSSGGVRIDRFRLEVTTASHGLPVGLHPLADSAADAAQPSRNSLQSRLKALEQSARTIRKDLQQVQPTEQTLSLPQASGDSVSNRATQELVHQLLVSMARSLPRSNGSHYFREKLPHRLAVITDEYMYNFYKDAFRETVYVSPDNVEDVIEQGFDLLLYVTCWRGLEGEEWRGIGFRPKPAEALERLLDHCAREGKPTVFQSIEDPSNYEYFLDIARRFDHVFTSDTTCIPRYVADLGHSKVHYGEYGANPQINNPIGNRRHTLTHAFFAGSYPERYPERCADMETVFDSILASGGGLQIADRNAGVSGLEYPERFRAFTMPPLDHATLQAVHKLFRYSLNFNSIKESPTMCAMRIYELQAQGRGIISNYALSVLNKFPEIRIVAHPESLARTLLGEPTDDEYQLCERLVRNVMTAHTSVEVAARMLTAIGLDDGGVAAEPTIAVIADDDALVGQSYPHIVRFSRDEAIREPERILEHRYWVAVDPSVTYGPDFLRDRVNAFKYCDVDYVAQPAFAAEADAPVHDFVTGRPDPAVTLFASDRVSIAEALDPQSTRRGWSGYHLPPYQASLTSAGEVTAEGTVTDPRLTVVVPVHNNGRFLETKCLPSLRRNTIWDDLEVLLVDDGSTDGSTPDICRAIAQSHPQVRFLESDRAASGSASRPRNRGVAAATAPLVAFLDPDNEISEGGYDTLLALFEEATVSHPDLGFVSGYQVKVGGKTNATGRHTRERLTIIPDLQEHFFGRGKFPVVSTQAAVIKRDLLGPGRLEFVEGAAGQDTLYGWELLAGAGVGAFTHDAHLLYYAERADSVTNVVDRRYFEKKLVMETAQVAALERMGLLERYVDHHLAAFVKDWYLAKLKQVSSTDRDACARIVRDIVRLYGVDPDSLVPGHERQTKDGKK
ncbi:glycosyltransferase [Aestuariimicrobium soli]|uniref:glycosyltransferase n=1 Tax=Aestuariimicrobium soli TaxID=2035834 RepID=UPI003EB9030C